MGCDERLQGDSVNSKTGRYDFKVGDLVRYGEYLGIVTCIDPEEIGDNEEVEVTWIDGDVGNASTRYLELVNAKD